MFCKRKLKSIEDNLKDHTHHIHFDTGKFHTWEQRDVFSGKTIKQREPIIEHLTIQEAVDSILDHLKVDIRETPRKTTKRKIFLKLRNKAEK